jgi:hypothetical protein
MSENFEMNALADSPVTSSAYKKLDHEARKKLIQSAIPDSLNDWSLQVEECQDEGSVYFSCSSLPVSERGRVLLDLESTLKESVDPGITVWLSPLGDRSALRKLRGVSISTLRKSSMDDERSPNE